MHKPNIKILGNRILVELDDVTSSGIQIPDAARKIKNRGTVVALGDGRYNAAGQLADFDVRLGDRVLLSEFAVTPYHEDGREFRVVAAEDILGVLL